LLSLGHDKTLIVQVGAEGRGGSGACPEKFQRDGYLHLSVGLEDPEELIKDHLCCTG